MFNDAGWEGVSLPPPRDEQKEYTKVRIIEDLIELLIKNNVCVINNTLVIDNLDVLVKNNIVLKSLQEVIVQSGRDVNKRGFVNSIHINPDLDYNNNPIRVKHIPFNKQRLRSPPRRPKKHNKSCRCCP